MYFLSVQDGRRVTCGLKYELQHKEVYPVLASAVGVCDDG